MKQMVWKLLTGALLGAAMLLTQTADAQRLSAPAFPLNALTRNLTSSDTTLPVLRTMLVDYHRYAETQWHTVSSTQGYWGDGKANGGNNGIRSISINAMVYAFLVKDGDVSATEITTRVIPALRYAAATYNTKDPDTSDTLPKSRNGTDGVQWGSSWQSAMWTGNLGTAAWLAKGSLDTLTLKAVDFVAAHEADNFIGVAPPTMLPGDTKAEENSWDLTAPAAALLLMPTNAHAAAWYTAVLTYGFNTISRASDDTSTTPADGKTVGDWVSTTQVFPDFTLENHGIFHPVYSMIGPATNAQAGVDYLLGGNRVPDALTFNVLNQWQMLQYIALPDGEWLYPQGLDWDLHDYEHIHYWTMLATLFQDPAAALLEQRTAGYARARQVINGDGSFVGPSGSLGFAREAVQAERVAFAMLMHQQFGAPPAALPSSWDTLAAGLAPATSYPYVGMVIHRTTGGVVSFSWMNHLMAQVVPQSLTHLDQPYMTTPDVETLVGGFTLQGLTSTAFTVNNQSVQTTADGFTAMVDASVNNGYLRQQIAISSVAPGVVAYVDRVTALETPHRYGRARTASEHRKRCRERQCAPSADDKQQLHSDGGSRQRLSSHGELGRRRRSAWAGFSLHNAPAVPSRERVQPGWCARGLPLRQLSQRRALVRGG